MAEEKDLGEAQRAQWQDSYATHPGMHDGHPSAASIHAASVFHTAGASDVLELGAGRGRDALFFAHESFTVQATDFSATGFDQLCAAVRAQGVAGR